MKKMMIFSGCIILVLTSMVFMSYGEMQKVAISAANLPDLKGKWIGSRVGGGGTSLNTDLEIFNDSLPIQGKFIFYDVTRPGQRGRTEEIDFKGGKINDQGNLFVKGANVDVELSLYEDGGKKKLEGNYYWMGVRATMSFKKK